MELKDDIKAQTLAEALTYLKRFHGKTVVLKYGGSLLGDESALLNFTQDVVLLRFVGIRVAIVHGGGEELKRWQDRVGTAYAGSGLNAAEMVLSGGVSSKIVSSINRAGGKAVGLSGKDASLILAKPMTAMSEGGPGGAVESVEVTLLRDLMEQGYIPVVSAVAVTREGDTVSIRSDEVASKLAVALGATKLIYATDVQGVMKGDQPISFLDYNQAKALLDDPSLRAGMKRKLGDAIAAIKGGVSHAHIVPGKHPHVLLLELLTESGAGTMISNDRVWI